MKVTVIGCGNAFSMENGNQSFLLEEGESKWLIDCGSRIPLQLAKLKIPMKSITHLSLSHAHADHIGGVEELAFTRYDWLKKPHRWDQGSYAPKLVGNGKLLQELWDISLKGGLRSMEGFQATMETFFEVVPLEDNQPYVWEGWKVDFVQQLHVMAGSIVMYTYGMIFSKEGHKTLYITTDSQHCSPSQMQVFYKQADIIIQDCECAGTSMQWMEGQKVFKNSEGRIVAWPTSVDDPDGMKAMELMAQGFEPFPFERYKFSSGVHASYAQLAGYSSANHVKLPKETKQKMWLSHYQDFVLHDKDGFGNDCDWKEEAKRDGFAGFVEVGQVIEV